jgi:SAM-dependent methyltransferase
MSDAPLRVEPVACPLCGGRRTTVLHTERDLALGVPGRFHVARCNDCGLLHQNPRVRLEDFARMYPPHYGPHARDPQLSRLLRRRGRIVRAVLATRLGYRHLPTEDLRWHERLRAALAARKIRRAFPPWTGAGRLLDVGCASGGFLQQMATVGWEVAGVEFDPEAAAKALKVTPRVFVGDPVDAPFAPGSFDVITAFHVLEHLPEPRRALERMLGWLAPGGLLVVEVPNANAFVPRVFGRYWSGFDYPRHLVHFTPRTLRAMVERAGGRVIGEWHWSKPRSVRRSLEHSLSSGRSAAARATLAALRSRIGRGVVKLALEIGLRPSGIVRQGEVARYFIRRADETAGARS